MGGGNLPDEFGLPAYQADYMNDYQQQYRFYDFIFLCYRQISFYVNRSTSIPD
jgi:hypothetical protein